MAFVKNTYQQLSFYDAMDRLSERERKIFEKSWAKPFGDEIFPMIDEEAFAGLYSEKVSRPNTPVNIVVGAILLARFLGLSDDEMIEAVIFDVRFQYALHTTGYTEQPFSTNTFRRFRARNEEYRDRTGKDPLEECLKQLEEKMAESESPRLRALLRRVSCQKD
ncbi:MAG: transposase [Eubacterium sp.]|nr:transposase [Eubacterium sp.]